MIPEIRQNLEPTYPNLVDHPTVQTRTPVPGLDTSLFFFSHSATETTDDQMSKCNEPEAEMIVHFFCYLVHNGVTPERITVLTYYNGQRKLIDRTLRKTGIALNSRVTVVTVDSYQGEENDIVLLSLVRSNVSVVACHSQPCYDAGGCPSSRQT